MDFSSSGNDPPQQSIVLAQSYSHQGAQPCGDTRLCHRMFNPTEVGQLDKRSALKQRFSNRVAGHREPAPQPSFKSFRQATSTNRAPIFALTQDEHAMRGSAEAVRLLQYRVGHWCQIAR